MNIWIEIVEADLQKLGRLEADLLVDDGKVFNPRLFYVQLMIAYFRQDHAPLQGLIDQRASDLAADPVLKFLAQMRAQVRAPEIDLSLIVADFVKLQESRPDPLFLGEGFFIAATAHQAAKKFAEAEVFYKSAAAHYRQAGVVKKALRARLSSIAAYSCLHPESRLFAEYQALYTEAVSQGEFLSAGTALLNLSREFQRLEGWTTAVDYATRGIELVSQNHFGSREYGLLLVQRAHLYLQKSRIFDAEQDLRFASAIGNVEVQAACSVVAENFNLNLVAVADSRMLATWEERRQEAGIKTVVIGKLEDQVLKLLGERPRDKYELIKELYGENLDLQSTENRLKNLLSRLRSRFPGLLLFEDGLYHLSEPSARQLLGGKGRR